MHTRLPNVPANQVEIQAGFSEADLSLRQIRGTTAAIRTIVADIHRSVDELKILLNITAWVLIGVLAEFIFWF